MLAVPRDLARRFRAVVRRGRPPGPAPPVRLIADGATVTLFADRGEVAVAVRHPCAAGLGDLVLPMTVLDAAAGPGSDPVDVTPAGSRRAVARWTDRGSPRELAVDLVRPPRSLPIPSLPADWPEVSATFVETLAAAHRVAGREPQRFATHRVQLQGKAGRVVATDGRQALVHAGFAVPFAEDVLVPAWAGFGAKEFTGDPVRVGRAGDAVVVGVGSWTVWLRIDATARFPDVVGVIPRSLTATVIELAAADVEHLLAVLPTLPGADAPDAPVTLHVTGDQIVVRAAGKEGESAVEVRLAAGSTVTGSPVRFAIDRGYLAQAMQLGCRTMRLAGPDKPMVAFGGDRTYLVAPLTADAVVGPADATKPDLENSPMPPPTNGRPDPAADSTDPLAEAEALKAAMTTAALQAGRLVAALKGRRKEQRALTQVWSSLRGLNLGRAGDPR